MTSTQIFEELRTDFKRQKGSAALLIAFIDFLAELGAPSDDTRGLEALFSKFPRQDVTVGKGKANTLIVARTDGSTLSLRPFYDRVEKFFRSEKKRFDFPSCAPYTTGIWARYQRWLEALTRLDKAEAQTLRVQVVDHVLAELKDQSFDASKHKPEPPLFRLLLENFTLTSQRGEPTGAAFQGVVFGYLRADNPHLQVEIDKVRTGSKRLQRVADVDGWDGARLAISAEVKQYIIGAGEADGFTAFANEVQKRSAIGLVVALGFEPGVRDEIEKLGVKALDRADLLRIVGMWDPLKQRTAIASLRYYASHVEKNASLTDRVDAFVAEALAPAKKKAATRKKVRKNRRLER